jgi:hypothetical protein
MKTKLVLWGNDKDDNRVLVALELLTADNKVALKVIPTEVANEELHTALMDKWREGGDFVFPENTRTEEQELTLAETLLPEDIKVEKTDIIAKAQAEWHFIVLSEKLHAAYVMEVEMLQEKIATAQSFDKSLWEELKNLQTKVQDQFKDRNLQRNHIGELRDLINKSFDQLKSMRLAKDAEIVEASNEVFDQLTARLGVVENKVAEGAKFNLVFDELKNLQRDLKTAKLVREQRNELWDRVDVAFKKAKERRFGPQEEVAKGGTNNAMQRLSKRHEGLMDALGRMEKSIKRDKEELQEQLDKIKSSNFVGVLEEQISQAKVNMIENRLASKNEKLQEMNDTRAELEQKINSIKEKDAKRAETEAPKTAEVTAEATEIVDTTEIEIETEETE